MILTDNLYGLILAGGKSSRMQQDKGEMQYHEAIDHRTFLYELLNKFCAKTFISCRQDQVKNLNKDQDFIVDEDLYGGPLNGLLSAHHQFADKAWLVLAVDLPHITSETIQTLLNERDPVKMVTAYATKESALPEPLIAIWEPASLTKAEEYAKADKFCPRKFLIAEDIKIIFPADDTELFNANFYADYLEAKNRMDK